MLDPANQNLMYYPGTAVTGGVSASNRLGIWRNTNLGGIASGYNFTGTTTNWEFLTNSVLPGTSTARITALGKASGSNFLYYGTENGQIYRIDDITAAAASIVRTDIFTGKGLPPGYVSCLAVDPTNGNNVFVVFSNYGVISIYYSTDAGVNWNAVAGNLEQNADGSGNGSSVRWLTVHAPTGGTKGYFVGTSTGLYYTETLNGNSTVWTQ
jgi:hypothetical protein